MPKTSSLWGKPPRRFYDFLQRVENNLGKGPLRIAILGCSDGKFVLPATRRGHHVLAIDIDAVALFGGKKVGPSGGIFMPGLMARLEAEGLSGSVEVVQADFVTYVGDSRYHGVFTSGAIQYSRNLKHQTQNIVASVQSHVCSAGYLYVDYMLPMEDKYVGRENYPSRC